MMQLHFVPLELLTADRTFAALSFVHLLLDVLRSLVKDFLAVIRTLLHAAVAEGDEQVAEIKKEFSFLFPRYSIEGLGWEINGRFMAHEYEITCHGCPIVSISKEWMTWGDSYELNIANPADEIIALAVVLTIDCVTESNSRASVTISSN